MPWNWNLVEEKLDRYRTLFNRKAIDTLESGIPQKTPEFHDYLINQKAIYDMDPEVQKAK
jgi:hypothetical protein